MKKWKKLVALLLCFVMVAGLLPVGALSVPAQAASGTVVTVKEAVYEDGSIDITVNSSAAYRGAKIAVACYDSGGKMTGIDVFNANLTAGDKSFSRELPEAFETCTVYVTDSAYRPFCAAVEAEEYTAPDPNQHYIYYDIANGDPYIQRLVDADMVENPNPDQFGESSAITLKNINVYGYRFLGWYDMPAGVNAQFVRRIPAGTDYDVYLYAHWEKIEYTVQFKSDVFIDTNEITYTVDKGAVLPTPKLSNYVFTGWSDETGHPYKGTTIPVGTTGNIVLTANWTSERNKTWTKTELDDPIIVEDEETDTILFAYEIGEIQNVPLYEIKNFGYIAEGGVERTEETTYTMKTSESYMQSFARAVSTATTESSDITLSSGWQDSTTYNKQWAQENELTDEEARSIATSRTGTWNVSSGTSGSQEVTVIDSNGKDYRSQAKIGLSTSNTEKVSESVAYNKKTATTLDVGLDVGIAHNTSGSVSYTHGKYSSSGSDNDINVLDKVIDFGSSILSGLLVGALLMSSEEGENESISAYNGVSTTVGGDVYARASNMYSTELSTNYGHSTENRVAREYEESTSSGESYMHTNSATDVSAWNRNTSYGESENISENNSASRKLSEKIAEETGYGKSYIENENWQKSQGFASTNTASDEYSSTVTYSAEESRTVTSKWSTTQTKAGYHRWIVAGTAHVFAVVGYDMKTSSYFIYTYTVMDDETHEFEDYSYTTAAYNDNENGVIPFEIPTFVGEYVSNRVFYSDGLKVNKTTGVITEYTGDYSYVIVPEYMNVGNGEVVKVTGISGDAFRGNTNIKAIVLSDFIYEIPDNAFAGCSSLLGVAGYGIKIIGNNAFECCTSFETMKVSKEVLALGMNAFADMPSVEIDAYDTIVAVTGSVSGAKSIVLNTKSMQNNEQYQAILSVPTGTEYFEFNGFDREFDNINIVSHADKTVINKAAFNGSKMIPVQIESPEVVMNDVTVNAPGIAMVLAADSTHFGLEGKISVNSDNVNTLLSKNLILYESNPRVNGVLEVSGKMFVCGTTQNKNLLTYGEYEEIDAETFERLLHSFKLIFDAKGGTCAEEYKEVPNGTPVGALPVPARQYYTFDGWYLEDNTPVTETTVLSSGLDQTVYAHWKPNTFTVTFDAQGGTASSPSKNVTFGSAISSLPTATKANYNFDGWYTAASGGTKITENTVFNTDENRTVYAHWSPKTFTVTFNANGGSCSTPSKNVTFGNKIGTLPTATKANYNFDGWFTAASGGTKIIDGTVFDSADNRTVYAHWSPKTFTVNFDAQGGSASYGSKQVTFGNAIGALPDARKDYNDFDGWFLGDGTKITENTVFNTAENRTVYAHWHEKVTKGWVRANEVPSGAQIIERKYSYTLRSYTTSSSSSMSGWTKYKETWIWSDWGGWSGWSDSAVSASDSRQVETRQVETNTWYHYYRWSKQREGGYGSYQKSSTYPNYYQLDLNSPLQETSAIDGHRRFMWWYSSSNWVGMYMCDPYITHDYKTQYRYRDRHKVYTYYFYKDENKESTSYPSGNDISNIVEWVKYREK